MIDSFATHLPPAALAYCQQLRQHYQFQFRVARPRQTRLGDFRVLPAGQTQITVNADLNPYAFLITYIHEVAHARVHSLYRKHQQASRQRLKRPKPHGVAWQQAFQGLMQPMLTESIFPTTILTPLQAYMQKPAASTSAHAPLMQALRTADGQAILTTEQQVLHDLPEGAVFTFHKKIFCRGAIRRTRIVCKEVPTGKNYTIPAHAVVQLND